MFVQRSNESAQHLANAIKLATITNVYAALNYRVFCFPDFLYSNHRIIPLVVFQTDVWSKSGFILKEIITTTLIMVVIIILKISSQTSKV